MPSTTRESPIFASIPNTKGVNVTASLVANYTLYTADATNGSVIEDVLVYEKGTGAVTLALAIVDGANTYVLGRVNTSGTQFKSTNILTNANFPCVDDANPQLKLRPSQVLQLQVLTSVANALDVVTFGQDFTT